MEGKGRRGEERRGKGILTLRRRGCIYLFV